MSAHNPGPLQSSHLHPDSSGAHRPEPLTSHLQSQQRPTFLPSPSYTAVPLASRSLRADPLPTLSHPNCPWLTLCIAQTSMCSERPLLSISSMQNTEGPPRRRPSPLLDPRAGLCILEMGCPHPQEPHEAQGPSVSGTWDPSALSSAFSGNPGSAPHTPDTLDQEH